MMDSQSHKHILRNLSFFTILVIALGWFGRWLDSLMGNMPSQGIGQLIWIIAPLGVSFLLRAFAGDGWKDLGIRPAVKGNILWYAVSVLVYPICIALILAIGFALNAVSFSDSPSSKVSILAQAFALAIVPMFFKNIFEEFGYRGYLAPKLHKLGLNAFVTYVIVGLIWGVWHLPYLAVFMSYTTESLATYIPHFLVGTVATSIVYGEIRILTNSVWPAVLMHTVGNVFLNTLFLKDYVKLASGMEYLVAPAVEGILSIVLFTLIGVGIYVLRKKRTMAPESSC